MDSCNSKIVHIVAYDVARPLEVAGGCSRVAFCVRTAAFQKWHGTQAADIVDHVDIHRRVGQRGAHKAMAAHALRHGHGGQMWWRGKEFCDHERINGAQGMHCNLALDETL